MYTLHTTIKSHKIPHNFTGIVEYRDGIKEWRVDGKRHRLDDPAIEYPDGSKEWFVDGKRHRLDGPAYTSIYGVKEWWIDDKRLKAAEYKAFVENLNKPTTLDGKLVEVDGKKYKMILVD